jgi:hypothetical protein
MSGGGGGGLGGAAGQPTGGGGLSGVTLIEWVDGLAENHTNATSAPDTVDDKAGVIMYTEDPAAFDPLLQKQPQ